MIFQTFVEKLRPTTTVLTPNQRLAAFLKKEYDYYQQKCGLRCWPSLDVLSLSTWLKRSYDESKDLAAQPFSLLLNNIQLKFIWEGIIENSAEGKALLQLKATTQKALQALELIQAWQIKDIIKQFPLNQDCEAFSHWLQVFETYCSNQNYLTAFQIPSALTDYYKSKVIPHPNHLLLVGFDEIHPQIKLLLNALIETHIEYFDFKYTPKKIVRHAFSQPREEIQAMIQWCKTTFEQYPQARIGCVVPNLNEIRHDLEIEFGKSFHPEQYLSQSPFPQGIFNISSGKALADFPLIQVALLLLNTHIKKGLLSEISVLLRSPFLGEAEQELFTRAQLDIKLRRLNNHTISYSIFLQLAKATCPHLHRRLSALLDLQKKTTEKMPPSKWAEHFSAFLNTMGWPGEREIDSKEYQLVTRFRELLIDFSSLDQQFPELTCKKATQIFKTLCLESIFQPQTEDAPIQVLGLLEASGLPFDYLWVMNVQDNQWPAAAKSNPFIPTQLQKKLGMPHACAERELTFYQKLTTRFQHSAAYLIFSYSLQDQDRQLRPSVLIQNIREDIFPLTIDEKCRIENKIHQTASLEIFEDWQVTPIQKKETLLGGSHIFKYQAACPFKAFSAIRLRAEAFENPHLGFSPKERGIILHEILELIWKNIADQNELMAFSDEALAEHAKACIHHTLEKFNQHHYFKINKKYLQLEMLRLEKIIGKWLMYEKSRPPFTVLNHEKKYLTHINGLEVSLQIDRIDRLENDEQVIIDYKTGSPSCRDLLGDRPNEPQLILYCMTNQPTITAVAFGEINTTKQGLQGLSKNDTKIKGMHSSLEYLHEDWHTLMQNWQATLERIGDAFMAGEAHVDPKEGAKTCQYCPMQTFCRIHEEVNL